MIQAYRELPDDIDQIPRPLLDVDVGHQDPIRVRCLADTGAVNTLMPGWVAELAGIDLADAPTRSLAVGGATSVARLVPIMLSLGEHQWEAEVAFCEPWPRGWGLLGQRSFFRYFEVTFRAADLQVELSPVTG